MRTLTTNEMTNIAGGLNMQDSVTAGVFVGTAIGAEIRRNFNIAQYTGASCFDSHSLPQSIALAAGCAALSYLGYAVGETVAESFLHQQD